MTIKMSPEKRESVNRELDEIRSALSELRMEVIKTNSRENISAQKIIKNIEKSRKELNKALNTLEDMRLLDDYLKDFS